MNPRIRKVTDDIEKTKVKISELQARQKELERQKTDLENTEIIGLFRSADVAPSELAGFIRAYKEQASPAYRGGTSLENEEDI